MIRYVCDMCGKDALTKRPVDGGERPPLILTSDDDLNLRIFIERPNDFATMNRESRDLCRACLLAFVEMAMDYAEYMALHPEEAARTR